MEHNSENIQWAWALRQLCNITIKSKAWLCPHAQDAKEQVGFSGTRGSSACMVNHKMVQAEKQAKNMTIWSINNKKKPTVFALLCGSLQVGERNVDSVPTEGAAQLLQEAIFPPSTQLFTSGSYRAIEHSPGTSTSPTSATKKHFKATLPTVPTLFHLSNAYKTVAEGQMLLRGATAHLLPASTLLKTLLLFIVDNTP